ncbi:RICIN domain-containing protein [Streptomyces genisteinicus]|uniref:RICIN domain-containing protein n=1 Tax=Streptomyces genisteinicus TaxID=2768068 RepID=A0A7H0I0A7_9ACTN|nr:RICIN domain-containing protein [Streptomyces genisteinicus]QNP66223.1 RICIN domain-containing protein [Streptomyces genisteinicus]
MTVDRERADEDAKPWIRTVAGTGATGFAGDGGPAPAAQLNRPYAVAVDGMGTLYFSDYSNHRIRSITTDGRISTVAGTGVAGFRGDNGPALAAQLNCPRELAVDGSGTLYVVDAGNHRVRKITADGTISTVAGNGTPGFAGDGGPATAARLNLPLGVAVDGTGAVYVAEYHNHRVRRIAADGTISTVAGTGAAGFRGDGGPATSALLNRPYSVDVDGAGALYVADAENHRIRKIAADGTISTVAGDGTAGFAGDGGPATAARLNLPLGVAVDSTGALHIADHRNFRVRTVAADGTIGTAAGTGTTGFAGDEGPAAEAQLSNLYGLAVDCVDALHIADHLNNRVRRIASPRMAGLPESGTVVSWANLRSRLRMSVLRESTRDGAEIHQLLAVPRDHQRWRLVASGHDGGEVLYRFENVRSGKVLEAADASWEPAGPAVAQRAYAGRDARHQHWRLIPVAANGTPGVYEIANGGSGLLLRVDGNARTVIRQGRAEGDHRDRQWQLLPV